MSRNWKGNLMLLLTAFIWGSAFVAQSTGMNYIGPFTFLAIRSFLGVIALLPVIAFLASKQEKTVRQQNSRVKITWIGGFFCGIILGVASAFQQVGLGMTSAGKAGFITALYIVIVPIVSIFIGKKIHLSTWFYLLIALVGFYLLSVKEGFSIGKGDLLVLCCAFCYSIHILTIDYFLNKGADPVKMSCMQFLISGILGLILTLLFETPSLASIWDAKIPLLYAGVLSSGVAYTLQIVGQKYTEPTIATLLMSLESVFAALTGWIVLHEVLSGKELLGCLLVFLAVILAQIPFPIKRKITDEEEKC